MKKIEICGGVNLTALENMQFKTSILSVNLVLPLKRETAAYYALIPFVLKRGSADHPNMEAVSRALDELYGASIDPEVRKKGEMQIIGFNASFIDRRYLPGCQNQLESMVSLLFELLCDPVLEDGSFVRDTVKSESANLIDRINAECDDKREYARLSMIKLMCEGEDFSVNRLGSVEDVQKITSRSLFMRYNEILQSARIEIIYSGPCPEDDLAAIIRRVFPLKARIPVPFGTKVIDRVDSVREKTEYMKIAQGKLVMGLRTGITSADKDYPAMMLFNAVYGSGVSSKLFMNVREKLSLCYYASSSLEPRKGILIVDSGVEAVNFNEARREIIAQLRLCQEGSITHDELESARLTIGNSLISLNDSLYHIEDYWLSQAVAGLSRTPEELLNEILSLEKRDAAVAADRVILDTVYRLSGNEVQA